MYTYDSSFIFVFHTQQSYTTIKSKVLLSSPTAVNTVNISLFLFSCLCLCLCQRHQHRAVCGPM